MDKLSALIQEAKPLYKRRKRIKTCILTLVILVVPSFSFTCLYDLYTKGNDVYLSMNSNQLQDELMLDSMKLLR